MGKRKYPRFGGKRKYKQKNSGGPCECCIDKTMAVGSVEIQVSYMRGDDETFRVCQSHMDMAESGNIDQLFRDYNLNNQCGGIDA